MSIGPNIRKLWAVKMAKDAIPNGGGFADGIKFLSSKDLIVEGGKKAAEWTKQAIQAIREAAEPNPFKAATDEEIAREILKRLESR